MGSVTIDPGTIDDDLHALRDALTSPEESVYHDIDVADQAFSFFDPKEDEFILTGFIISGSKTISEINNARVVIYQAASPTSTAEATVEGHIKIELELLRSQTIALTSLNILVNQGMYLNAVSSDTDVFMTLIGHYLTEVH